MALGQGQRPLEAKDGTKVTVEPRGYGRTVIYMLDPDTNERLDRIERHLDTLVTLAKIIAGHDGKI
jgi:hypothetical protein